MNFITDNSFKYTVKFIFFLKNMKKKQKTKSYLANSCSSNLPENLLKILKEKMILI